MRVAVAVDVEDEIDIAEMMAAAFQAHAPAQENVFGFKAEDEVSTMVFDVLENEWERAKTLLDNDDRVLRFKRLDLVPTSGEEVQDAN